MSLLFRYFTVLTWLLGCGCLTSTSLGRQIQVPTPLSDSFEAGIQAFKTGQYEIAIAHFNEVFEASPGYIQRDVGSVAFWLGRTYEAIDNPLAAGNVWFDGWTVLGDSARLDPLLADVLVNHVFTHQDSRHYEVAAEAYLSLLDHLDGDLPAELHVARSRHLVPLLLILPGDVRVETGLTDTSAVASGFVDGMSRRLITWWHSMDPLPATTTNERLVEHLKRVGYALVHYSDDTSVNGFDARGEVYVRLGPPSHRTILVTDIGDPKTPRGAFWYYRHIDPTAHYIFVKEWGRRGYRLGQPQDLVPPKLRTPSATLSLLVTLENLYRDLALVSPGSHFGLAYEQLANYRNNLEMDALSAELVTTDFPAHKVPRLTPPIAFVQKKLGETRLADRRAASRRDEVVPPSVTNVFDTIETLPVAVRHARFLEPDGVTRTEVYWSLETTAIQPSRRSIRTLQNDGFQPSDDYLVLFSGIQQNEEYIRQSCTEKRYLIQVQEDEGPRKAVLPAQEYVVRSETSPYALAMQWDVYWIDNENGQNPMLETKVKNGTAKIDTLRTLSNALDRLEMSDLKPIIIVDTAYTSDMASAYVFNTITRDIPLGLYFEVYHLSFGPDDRTHYTVTYEVARQTESGWLRRRLDEIQLTSAQTRQAGENRTAQETILLDLSAWKDNGDLVITVSVKDETAGETVERSISFEMENGISNFEVVPFNHTTAWSLRGM